MARPFVKWAGGKEKELDIIFDNLPQNINNFIEPFVGGGAVYLAFEDLEINGECYINDFSEELIQLYNMIANNDNDFFNILNDILHNWNLLSEMSVEWADDLLNIYHDYKQNNNRQELRDSITTFMLHHNEAFNGMHDMQFNRRIDEFDATIRKCLERKIIRVCKLEDENGEFGDANVLENIETALKSAFYTHIRSLYNDKNNIDLTDYFSLSRQSAFFYFIREFCYASMFRYNHNGEFNVPYGGMGYNKKNFANKIQYISEQHLINYLAQSHIFNQDFEVFLNELEITHNDFIFIDPPYDTEFSEYAQNEFNKDDQVRLADYLANLDAKIMIVIKYTPFIEELYRTRGFNIFAFDKTYMVNFQNRNNRKVSHLLIKNY